MMLSPKYAPPVVALLMLALVPTVIHSYRGVRRDDGWRAASMPATLAQLSSTPTERRPAWVQNTFDTTDWIERTYMVDGIETTLFVARSYDPKRLYHHPELALLRGHETTPAGVVDSTRRPGLPLHVIETERGGKRGVAVYALHYDDGYIGDPLRFQIRTAVELLVSGRRPMTLFMTHALAGRAGAVDDSPAGRLLLQAVEEFDRQSQAASAR